MEKKRRLSVNNQGHESWKRQSVYNAKVTIRCRLYLISTIKGKLSYNADRYALFKNTVLGPWLDLRSQEHDNHVLNFLLQHQKHIDNPTYETPMYFEIENHTLEFGRREFCLMTGLRFGKISLNHLEETVSGFSERVFPGISRIKGYDLISVLESASFHKMSNEDAVRLCMLLLLVYVLMGQELRHVIENEILCLVDDFYAWDAFPWGEYMWRVFHDRVYNVVLKKRKTHLKEFVQLGDSFTAKYNLYGFVFALKIFVLESYPISRFWWKKEDNVIPRCVAWSDHTKFHKSDYKRFFYSTTPLLKLMPTPIENQSLWWRSSIEFFQLLETSSIVTPRPLARRKFVPRVCNRVKKEVIKEIKHEVREQVKEETDEEEEEVSEEEERVDQRLNGMSKSALVKKLADMQRELTNYKTISTRLTAIEQLLKPQSVPTIVQKAESIGLRIDEALNGGDNSVIASNGVKAGESGFHNLVDIPVGVGYVKDIQKKDTPKLDGVRKIPDFSVDLSGSVNNRNLVDVSVSVSNTLKAAYEGVKKDNDNLVDFGAAKVLETGTNVVKGCVSNPSDVQTGKNCTGNNVVKNVVSSPLDNEELREHPLDDDNTAAPTVDCVDKFVTNSNPGAFIHPSQDNNDDEMMHDGVRVDNICPSPSEGLVAVEALMDLISFTPPPESSQGAPEIERDNDIDMLRVDHGTPGVQLVNEAVDHGRVKTVQVPFARERKKSVYLQDPFTDPPATTPRVRRKRKQKDYAPKKLKPLLGADGKQIELLPWTEDLTRPKGSPPNRVNTFRDINLVLRTQKEDFYSFPWSDAVVDWTFWSALLCKDGRKGWLSDQHIDLWVLYMMHFRPNNADWVAVSPFFSTMILNREMPLYYADGVTYGVPWFSQSVEKVYFPVNETEVHWCLAELDIRSGVITVYDSLGGFENPDEDARPWWENWMNVVADHLPYYLEESEVLERKNIDYSKYCITFRWAKNLPIQGPTYGDCGIWLCIFLYRLTHHLPLAASDPVEVALAYREQLTSFYWKYKIIVPNPRLI